MKLAEIQAKVKGQAIKGRIIIGSPEIACMIRECLSYCHKNCPDFNLDILEISEM